MKKSFVLFNNWEKIFAKLPDHLQGQLVMAIFAYAGRGELPEDIDPMVDVAFAAMQDALDDNEQKYRDTLAKRSEAGKKGGRPRKVQDEPEVQDETHGEVSVGEEIEETEKSKCFFENPVTDTVTVTDTVNDYNTLSHSQSHGQYGWVKLTDQEYQALVNELGEPELNRCIAYVDQCAQGNGNKNQWSDWAVILRRASQNQWGKQTKQSKGNPNKKSPVPWGSSSSIPNIDFEKRAMEQLMREYGQGQPELQVSAS